MNDGLWVHPWKGRAPESGQATLACVYEIDLGIAAIPEAAFLHRTSVADELWTVQVFDGELDCSCPVDHLLADRTEVAVVAGAPVSGTPSRACETLLDALFRSRVGFEAPADFLKPGLVGANAYHRVTGQLESELGRNRTAAVAISSHIIDVARALHLNPWPEGSSPYNWLARCPDTNHSLMISSKSEQFGCGYCARRGNAEDLKAFVRERKGAPI